MARGRSAIRTAAGTTQELFLERLRRLRDDPELALPDCPWGAPPAIERLRHRLSRMKGGKVGALARLDRGFVGAMARTLPLAQRSAATHLLDARIEGQRRFYLIVGHLPKPMYLGIQNFDDPLALMLAYGDLARRDRLWLFAGSRLWCTKQARPPAAWFTDLAESAHLDLALEEGSAEASDSMTRWGCRHPAEDRVHLRLGEGPAIALCAPCTRDHPLVPHLNARLLGPDPERSVAAVVVRADGGELPVTGRLLQNYRNGVAGEAEVIREAVEAWRKGHGAGRFVLGSRDFEGDQDAFLDALSPKPWERGALKVATATGHIGPEASVSDVLAGHPDRWPAAVATVLGSEPTAFLASRQALPASEVLRQAYEEQGRRRTLEALPGVTPSGPLGAWIDDWTRFHLTHGRSDCLERLRREVARPPVGKAHLFALNLALGGDLAVEARFAGDEKEAGRSLEGLLRLVLDARGDAYLEALQHYLAASGSGENA
ncbi:MAG: hypothetical protein ACYDBQ_09525 [Thermoplasmatota archaeon]